MVRIWRERNLIHPEQFDGDWQGEIEQVQTGERWSFESVNALLTFLHDRMEDLEGAHPERSNVPKV
jgi:hypothetical protein